MTSEVHGVSKKPYEKPPSRTAPRGMTLCVCGAADYCGTPKACYEEWWDRLNEDYAEEKRGF